MTVDLLTVGDVCQDNDPVLRTKKDTVYFVFGNAKGKIFVGYHIYQATSIAKPILMLNEVPKIRDDKKKKKSLKIVSICISKGHYTGQGTPEHRIAVAYENKSIELYVASFPNSEFDPSAVKLHALSTAEHIQGGISSITCDFFFNTTRTFIHLSALDGKMLLISFDTSLPFGNIDSLQCTPAQKATISHINKAWRECYERKSNIEPKEGVPYLNPWNITGRPITCMRMFRIATSGRSVKYILLGTSEGSVEVHKTAITNPWGEELPYRPTVMEDVHEGKVLDVWSASIVKYPEDPDQPHPIYSIGEDMCINVIFYYNEELHFGYAHSFCVQNPRAFAISGGSDAVIVGNGGLQVLRLCDKTNEKKLFLVSKTVKKERELTDYEKQLQEFGII